MTTLHESVSILKCARISTRNGYQGENILIDGRQLQGQHGVESATVSLNVTGRGAYNWKETDGYVGVVVVEGVEALRPGGKLVIKGEACKSMAAAARSAVSAYIDHLEAVEAEAYELHKVPMAEAAQIIADAPIGTPVVEVATNRRGVISATYPLTGVRVIWDDATAVFSGPDSVLRAYTALRLAEDDKGPGQAAVMRTVERLREQEGPKTPERAPLSMPVVNALAALVGAAQRGARIARAFVDQPSSVVYGTARSIGDVNGNHMGPRDDVRDCYLRVTTVNGWEAFWLVSELVEAYQSDLFLVDVTIP